MTVFCEFSGLEPLFVFLSVVQRCLETTFLKLRSRVRLMCIVSFPSVSCSFEAVSSLDFLRRCRTLFGTFLCCGAVCHVMSCLMPLLLLCEIVTVSVGVELTAEVLSRTEVSTPFSIFLHNVRSSFTTATPYFLREHLQVKCGSRSLFFFLLFSLRSFPTMGRLDVRICAAKNLPNTQLVGSVDPYAIVKLENHVFNTRVIENSVNPEWNDIFKFAVADPDSSQLRIEVWNKNLTADDFLGCVMLSLSGLPRDEVSDRWHLLTQCKSNAEIHVRLHAVDFGTVLPKGPAPMPPQQQMPMPMQQMPPQQMQMQQQMPPQQQPYAGYPPPAQGAQGWSPQPPPGGYPPAGGAYAPGFAPPPQGSPVVGAVVGSPQCGVYGSPAPLVAQQPQWGAGPRYEPSPQPQSATQQVLSGLNSIGSLMTKSVSQMTSAVLGFRVTGLVFREEMQGTIFLLMDGSLRQITDPGTTRSFYAREIVPQESSLFRLAQPPMPVGRPLPPFCRLAQLHNLWFIIDADPATGGAVKRPLDNATFAKYNFYGAQCDVLHEATAASLMNGPPVFVP